MDTTPHQPESTDAGAGGCPARALWEDNYDALAPEELSDPLPSFARARKEAPVFLAKKLGVWQVTRQEDVLAVLRDNDHFSASKAMPMVPVPAAVAHKLPLRNGVKVFPSALTLLLMDEPEHMVARSVIQKPFTPRRLKDYEPVVRKLAEDLFDRVEGNRIDFLNEFALPLALGTICDIVGIPESDRDFVAHAMDAMFLLNGMGVTDEEEVIAKADMVADYWQLILGVAESRCAEPQDDLTSVIAQTPKSDGSLPTPSEVAAHMHSIVGPGFESSAQALTHAVAALLTHRDQWELLKSDRSLLDSAITETLRYHTVIKRIFRVTTADVVVGGVTIPEGAVVAPVLASANHDETVYPEPERFDIRRRGDNLALGKGTHFCIGAPLARLELKVMLETLLDRFPDAEVPSGQELAWRREVRVYGVASFDVDLRPGPDRSQS